jgi:4-hydroxy-4-methyl-2-oxoglutarate aldolase
MDWSGIPSPVVSDSLARFGAMAGGIRQLTGLSVFGPAHTISVMPADNRTIHESIETVEAGSVLVIDAGGYLDRAVWGEVLTVAAQTKEIAGVVIDGAVRDLAPMRALGFPVFARGASPAGPHKAGGGIAGNPISCGGVIVRPGDMIIGDEDGVAVIPHEVLAETYDKARTRMATEAGWIRRIIGGETTLVVLGLSTEEELRNATGKS